MRSIHHSERKYRTFRFSLIILLLALLPYSVVCEEKTIIDYNSYYRFPFSFGIEYTGMFPLQEYIDDYDFTIMDISANLSIPISFYPRLKLLFRTGTTLTFGRTSLFEGRDNKYDHTDYYAGAGLAYTHMFSKTLEAGANFLCGLSSSVFPQLDLHEGTSGTYNYFIEAGATASINPIFNFSIEIRPSLRYTHSLLDMDFFDGLVFSIGGSLNFRLGEDPDISPLLRSIRFSNIRVDTLFAAMRHYYRDHPVGEVTITNTSDDSITDIQVSFYQAGYMDTPTPAGSIREIDAGESVSVPFYGAFNEEIFKTEGITPLTGEIVVSYNSKGKSSEQREAVMYDLHDKTALIWDDNRKVAAFITPSDGIIKTYAAYLRQAAKDLTLPAFNVAIQTAIQAYAGLGETGCLYQTDPLLPFEAAQGNTLVVDSVNLPRQTLKSIAGDCDDLTVLYLSLLETQGVETGFITVPGHILPVINTAIPARHYRKVHPDRSRSIIVEGEVWIPVEVTMVGKGSFLDAWFAGIKRWQTWEHAPEKRNLYRTRDAQRIFRPVSLKEETPDFSFGNAAALAENVKTNLMELTALIKTEFARAARQSGNKADYNKLGIVYAEMNQFGEAEKAFAEALRIEPSYSLAKINMGNLRYQQGMYDNALSIYLDALEGMNRQTYGASRMYTKLLLKISVVYYRLQEFKRAEEFFAEACENDPEEVEQYSYIVSENSSENRGSDEDLFAIAVNYLEDE
ncbi:MAG: tetratricopeptide repeat protein [Spirochaetales bacterium]|nr:tetratricopeptide repeat protein [Spirochaetales bacterium]